jgi:hypothetical protein
MADGVNPNMSASRPIPFVYDPAMGSVSRHMFIPSRKNFPPIQSSVIDAPRPRVSW